jgi:hypothetical protein
MRRSLPPRLWLPVALAVVVVAVLALAAARLFERVETEAETGFRGEARRDPLLAARRLLAELGLPVAGRQAVEPLPPPDHVLLLLAPEGALSIPEAGRLLAWVEAGGHLIATPQAPLLERLGAAVETVEEGPEAAIEIEASPGRAYRVRVAGRRRLADPAGDPELASEPEEGRLLRRIRRGEGLATLLAEAGFLDNGSIGQEQHAAFLWALVHAGTRPAGVAVVGGLARPTLAALAVRHGGPVLLAGGFLLLAWAAHRAPRFGPPLPDPPRSRRSLLEHVRASGEFLWRQGRGVDLLAATRRGLEASAARREPGWDRLDERERVARLARASGRAVGEVAWAFSAEAPADPASFARMVEILEQVRRAL